MLGPRILAAALDGLDSTAFARRMRAWPVESQARARRNALVASTACAQRRHEREDAAAYVAARANQTRVVTAPVRRTAH